MKFSKNSMLMLLLAIMLALVVSACSGDSDDDAGKDGDAGESGAAQNGGDLVIATASDAVSLDPAGSNDVPSFDVQYNIFEKLVRQDENMELHPSLAVSWENVDETTWEFKLQEGVTFHDGEPFNAEAAKMNLERLLDPDVAAPTSYLLDMVTEVNAIDEYTLQIKTEYAFGGLLAHLAHPSGGMISPKVIEADYEAMSNGEAAGSAVNANPVGTGYFKFEEWNTGTSIKLVKNDNYWDGEAKLDSVTFKVVPEDLTRIAELNTGDSHISNPLSASDVAQVESTDGLYFNQQGSVALDYLGFNVQKAPFDDVRVRQAITMAIDKSQIINGIAEGYALTAEGPLAPNTFGYDETIEGLGYDVEAAKELLAEAGYADGFDTTIWTNDTRERQDIAQNVQSQLAAIGINVEIEIFEWGAYLEQVGNGEHDMFILGWSNSTADADNGLAPLFATENMGAPGNRTFYSNEEFDQLLEDGRTETDETARLAIYKEASEILIEDAPMVYLMHKDYLMGVREQVKGLTMLPTKILQLKDVYIEE